MTHTNADTTLDSKIQNLTNARDRWMRAVSLLEDKLTLFRDADKLMPGRIPKNAPLALKRDLDSLNAGLHQVDIFNSAIANLEKERSAALCNTPTNTTQATPTTLSS